MLRNLSDLNGMSLHARDGDIGKVEDFYFDDESWVIRFLIVRTGGWLMGKRVLVSPISVERVDWLEKEIRTRLQREQVENSPEVDTVMPVSRREELKLHLYYDYPVYWGGSALWGNYMDPAAMALRMRLSEPERKEAEKQVEGDEHLRSSREVTGYHIGAVDGDIGHVEDFLVEDHTWALRYIVVDTRNWLPGRKVLIFPEWIEEVDWVDRKVRVTLSRGMIESSPDFESPAQVDREYEGRLFAHYRLPDYWSG
ncbi:MAG: PRC-barrel domain-containing protein [Spirochaetales bacterium]|nr:PRC-barrel domain-containing protein [Spirochaetales bacterium]